MAHGNFFWYDLVSKRPKASRDFLVQLFGWTASDTAMPDGTPYTSFSSGNDLICGLIPLNESRDYEGGRAYWITYIQVERLFSAITRAQRQGGEVLSEAQPIPDLGSYQFIRDPDGALISLVEARHRVLTPGFAWNSVTWNELVCRQIKSCEAFYQSVVGWDTAPADGELDYSFFTSSGANIAGFLDMSAQTFEGLRPGWQTYFSVENVDQTTEKVEACGGHVAVSPFDLPGVGRLAIIIEPGEAILNLLTPL